MKTQTTNSNPDYHPFGMTMQGRSFVSESYRYGYQGSEKDVEMQGGSAYTTHFRMLDVRLGRWFSPDVITQPWQSSYTSMDNNPVALTDVLGAQAGGGGGTKGGDTPCPTFGGASGGGSGGGYTVDPFQAAGMNREGGAAVNFAENSYQQVQQQSQPSPRGLSTSKTSNWVKENLPGIIGTPLSGTIDITIGLGEFTFGLFTLKINNIKLGLEHIGLGFLNYLGLKEAFTEIWKVPNKTTNTKMPNSLADILNNTNRQVPTDAGKNGMHAWHAGTNASLTSRLGPIGGILVWLGGLYHETFDFRSFKAEQYWQGTINHFFDSSTDLIANSFGMVIGLLLPPKWAIKVAIKLGNHIPGPGDPDPNFGGGGRYKGNPIDAWGQYPGW